MALNSEWQKWCYASICKHFRVGLSGKSLLVDPQTRGPDVESEVYELRIDGPETTEYSANEYKLDFEVNILIKLALEGGNIYSMSSLIGGLTAIFSDIQILKLGPGVSDDGSFVGECLTIVKKGKTSIRSFNYGQIETGTKEQQHCVEATYTVTLTGV